MKLLCIAMDYPPAPVYSTGRYACELNQALAQREDMEVHVLCCGAGDDASRSVGDGVRVHTCDCTMPVRPLDAAGGMVLRNVPLAGRAGEIIQEHGPFDFVCVHDWPAALAGQAASCGHRIPMVFFLHHIEVARRRNRLTREQYYVAELERFITQKARAVVVPSASARDEAQRVYGVPKTKITVLRPGADHVAPMTAPLPPDFRQMMADEEGKVVLYVGRLAPEKGLDVLLRAMQTAGEQHPEAKLVVAGDGPLRGELAKQAQDLAVPCLFTGHVDGRPLAAAYGCADVVVVPGLYEPMGLSIVEAMASGKPVVASDTGCVREVLIKGGEPPVPQGESRALGDAVSRVLDGLQGAQAGTGAAPEKPATTTWAMAADRAATLLGRLRLRRKPRNGVRRSGVGTQERV